jgi:adenylosuccinate synthase
VMFDVPDEALAKFAECCAAFADYVQPAGIAMFDDIVFEGAQGLLLDQHRKEFLPHVTHSNTGVKNVEVLCAQAGVTEKEIYYVSRTYLTRHGAGPLPGEDPAMQFEDETNRDGHWQGPLRFAPLDADMHLRCASDSGKAPFKLALTHCDQLAPTYRADLYCNGPMRTTIEEEQIWLTK